MAGELTSLFDLEGGVIKFVKQTSLNVEDMSEVVNVSSRFLNLL
jgi:hypothetical protein